MNLSEYLDARTVANYAGLLLSYVVMLGAVVVTEAWLFLVGALCAYCMEVVLLRWAPVEVTRRLGQLRMVATTRALLRQLLLLGLIAVNPMTSNDLNWVILSLLGLFVLQFAGHTVVRFLGWRRKLPVVTRNIDLTALRIPNSPPMVLFRDPMDKLPPLDALVVLGALGAMLSGTPTLLNVGATAAILLTVAYLLLMTWHLWKSRTIPRSEQVMEVIQQWVDGYRPEVVVYFCGSPESAYQVNMWLESTERLPLRPLVILRERAIAAQLAPTPVPVICIPQSTDLMALDFGPARVALYPANTGKNIHLLRHPVMRHVFIGHGDSDKVASINPFSKVYDEVWTAGKAGRDRYASAEVGVRDETIVEVGRPQLDSVPTDTVRRSRPTVLYAPTWEGWTDDPGNTSLIDAGPHLVEKLLQADPPVRVLYKPHPFTGIRSREAVKAHKRIVSLLEAANSGRSASSTNRAAMAELERRIADFDEENAATDEAQLSRDQGHADPEAAAQLQRLVAQWHQLYWEDQPDDRHLVIQGPRPGLYSCFQQADLLISDISSVVADFIATEKPYAIANCAGISDEEFREAYPTSQAAYLLTPDGEGLTQTLRVLHWPEADHRAEERRVLREYLLGPSDISSQERFNAAALDLYRRAAEQYPVADGALVDASGAVVPMSP